MVRSHRDEDGTFMRSVGLLTQLTGLGLEIILPAASLKQIAELPLLTELTLRIGDVNGDACLCPQSTCLSRLDIVPCVSNFQPKSLSSPSPAVPELCCPSMEFTHVLRGLFCYHLPSNIPVTVETFTLGYHEVPSCNVKCNVTCRM